MTHSAASTSTKTAPPSPPRPARTPPRLPTARNLGGVADEDVGRDPQFPAQPADHRQGERPATVQDLRNPRAAAEDALQVRAGHPGLLHPETDRVDRVRRIDR